MRFQRRTLTGVLTVFLLSVSLAAAQQASDTHLVIVTDVSPSMGHNDPEAVDRKAGQMTLLYLAALDEGVLAGLVHFTDKIEKSLPVKPLLGGDDFRGLDKTLESFDPQTVLKARTDISQGLKEARRLLEDAAKENPGRRLDIILLMSDGDYDQAPRFLAPNPADPQGRPNWQSGGQGSEIWAEVEELRKRDIVLHTVPVHPGIYGRQGVGTEEQRRQQQSSWQKGQELLLQMARATGGNSFLRVPGQLDFAQIYSAAIREKISTGPEIPDRNGYRGIHPLHRRVAFIGKGLRSVILPSGKSVVFPSPEVGNREDRLVAHLGTEYTFRRLAGVELAIFRRPEARSLEDLIRRGWSGNWRLDVGEGDPASVRTVAFSDLRFSSKPTLATRYWPRESVSLEVFLRAPFLDQGRLPDAEVAELREGISCRAELRDETGRVINENVATRKKDPSKPEKCDFELLLKIPKSGRFTLVIRVLASFRGEAYEVLRANQPGVVKQPPPVRLLAFRERDGTLEQIYGPDTEGVGSLRPGDGLVLQAEVDPLVKDTLGKERKELTIDTITVKKGAEIPQGLQKLDRPSAKDLRFSAFEHAGGAADRSFDVTVQFAEKSADGQSVGRSVILSVPGIPISSSDIVSRALLMAATNLPRTLYVGETFDWRFTIRLFDVSERLVQEIPDGVKVVICNQDKPFLTEQHTVVARRVGVKPVAGGVKNSWDVEFLLPLKPEHLQREGLHGYSLAHLLAGLEVKPEWRGIDVRQPPIRLTLRPKTGSPESEQTLRAYESLIGRLTVIAPAELKSVESLTLRWLAGAEVLDRDLVFQRLRMTEAGRAEAEFPPLIPVARDLVAEAAITVRPDGDPEARPVRLRFQPSFQVIEAPLEVTGRLAWENPSGKPSAGQLLQVSVELTLRGGKPQQRRDLLPELKSLLSQRPDQWLSARSEGTPAALLAAESSAFEDPEPEDSLGGAVTFKRVVSFRMARSGQTEIGFRPKRLSSEGVGWNVEGLTAFINPCPYYLRLLPSSSDDPLLLDTRQEGGPKAVLRVLPGEKIAVELEARDRGEQAPEGLSAAVYLTPGREVQLKPVAGSELLGRKWMMRTDFFPVEASLAELHCEVRSGEGRLLAVLGPYSLGASDVQWEFVDVVRPPGLVPDNVQFLMDDLEIRARCLNPERLEPVRNRLKFRLEVAKDVGEKKLPYYIPCTDLREEGERGEFVLIWKRPRLFGGSMNLKPGDRLQVKVQAYKATDQQDPGKAFLLGAARLFDLDVDESPLRMEVLLSEPGSNATPPPTSGIELDAKGWIYARAVWNDVVARRFGVSQSTSSIRVFVESRTGEKVQGQEWKDDWRRFYLYPGEYTLATEGILPLDSVSNNMIPGYVVGDRREIFVSRPPLLPTWVWALCGVLVPVVVVGLYAVWTRTRHPRPGDAVQLSVQGTQVRVDRLGAAETRALLGQPQTVLARVWRGVRGWFAPSRTDVYAVRHAGLGSDVAREIYLEFATRNGDLFWRQIEPREQTCGAGIGHRQTDVQVEESGHDPAPRSPGWGLPLAAVKGWFVKHPQPRRSNLWVRLVWRVAGRPYRAQVHVAFAGAKTSASAPSVPTPPGPNDTTLTQKQSIR